MSEITFGSFSILMQDKLSSFNSFCNLIMTLGFLCIILGFYFYNKYFYYGDLKKEIKLK